MAEMILGLVNPSGKLVDTFAGRLEDYPSSHNFHDSKAYVDYEDDIYVGYRYFETIPGASDKVNYPFGFGLSYTTFDWSLVKVEEIDGQINVQIDVTNTGGGCAGKEVLQLYVMAPQGQLGKANKTLAGFKKTRLLMQGEQQSLYITFNIGEVASYDDLGRIQKSAYVLEKGDYRFFIGTSVRDGQTLDYTYSLLQDKVVKQLRCKLSPSSLAKRLQADGSYESLPQSEPNNPNENVLSLSRPDEIDGFAPGSRSRGLYRSQTDIEGVTLTKVANGEASVAQLIEGLSNEELAHLLGGQPNTGVANTFGFGNLPEYEIINAMTADGPAGLRINKECGVNTTAWPCSTLLACSWNEDIVFKVGEAGGAKEVKENNLAIWLTPAVNIHRSPLCGRNFEYYSEDPFVTGKLAAAMVRGGIQSMGGISSAVKHFALNNKETNRKDSDSRVSERAAREIYLKGFEMVVKESAPPWCIMSSYNMINGHRASENRELLEDILRDEWAFDGVVTTDWWTYGEHYKEVKAGNDVKMACGFPDRLLEAMDKGALTRQEMEVSATRVLELLLKFD